MNNTEKYRGNTKDPRKIIQDAIVLKNHKRQIVNRVFTGVTITCVVLAMIPLGSILFEVVKNGISAISFEFLTQPPGSMIQGTGGIGPAIQGTLLTVGYASLIGIPVGILAGIYLSE
ncbi:MAG: phosphate ABC transporter, permease protein PstA, partial [Nitrososphaera sp.]